MQILNSADEETYFKVIYPKYFKIYFLKKNPVDQ